MLETYVPGPTPATTAQAFCEAMVGGFNLRVSLASLMRTVCEEAVVIQL